MNKKKIIARDPVWYPFTQMSEFLDESPLAIVSGQGCRLVDGQGKTYIDGFSSLWANVHGHRHPVINAALKEQLGRIAHSTMLGLTHPGGIELARRLIERAPATLARVFYSDSGATAVEIALKMAYQYWQLKGEKQKYLFLKLGEAYHGDTIGAVSLGGMDIFHERFGRLLFDTVKIPTPHIYRHPFGGVSNAEATAKFFARTEELIEKHAEQACAVIVEPLIQGAAGMIVHPTGYLAHLRELTRRYNLLLIVDEVAVGFGRTGKMFASEWEGVSPDIMCLGKGITGGYLPLAATLATEDIFAAYLGEHEDLKTFYHGHTYTGNPLACAAALASLDIFEQERTLSPEVFGPKAEAYAAGMARLAELPQVGSVRFRGLMGGVELVRDKETKEPFPFADRVGHKVCLEVRKHGVILRPLGDVIVILPPLAISVAELETVFATVEKAISTVIS